MKPSGRSSTARRRQRRSNLGGRSRPVEPTNNPILEVPGNGISSVENKKYGVFLYPKHKNSLRMVLQNGKGLPVYSYQEEANREVFQAFTSTEADIYAVTETNVHWRMLEEDDRLYARMQTWFQSLHMSLSYNSTRYPAEPRQYGGVGIFSINKASHRVLARGQDKSRLGRWSSTQYRGKEGISMRVVIAYCPHDKGGDSSVYGQHRHFFHEQGKPRMPRQAFWEDLLVEVRQWLADGDQLVLAGDWNEDVNVVQRKYFSALGIREVLLEKYGSAPNTFEFGSKPIDGIFMSSTLEIQQGGYLPFGDGIPSDHRALWVDISYSTAFGHNMPPISKPQARRLTCKHPTIRNRFIEANEKFVSEHKLLEKTQALLERASYPLTEYDQRMFEWLDQMKLVGIKYADKQCRKLRMGDVSFSPEVLKCWKTIEAWKCLRKKVKGGQVSARKLQRTMAKADLDEPNIFALSEAQCTVKLEIAQSKYRVAKKAATAKRETWLDELAAALAAQGQTEKAKILQRLKREEGQRRTFRKLKYLRGRLRSGSVTFVQKIGPDGIIQDVTEKSAMENLILEANENKYRQCETTPMMTQPLLSDFGYLGIHTEAAQQVMDGEYECPPGSTPFARQVLQQFAMSDLAKAAEVSSQEITIDEWRRYWKSARENTSSGPSVLHFGVLKAHAHSLSLASFDCWMTEIPRRSGYSPCRWRKAIDAVLWKKPGVFLLETTRTIVLLEPDFNFLNKHVSRIAMINAELFNQLAKEQYGSRRYHRSIDQGSNKRLTTDMFLLRREPGALCSNDARGCYDRINLVIAALAMLRQRIEKPSIECMINTLQNLIHIVRTAYGDSDNWYGGTPSSKHPLQGSCQGNGAGPQIWANISSGLLDTLRAAGFGAKFISAVSQCLVEFVGFSLVDDTDQVQSSQSEGETMESIAAKIQAAVNLWEGGIWVSGGALAPAKSHWYAIDFRWKDGQCRLANKDETPFQIYIRDSSTGLPEEIERLDVTEARTTLGVNQCPSGCMESQKQRMIKITTQWAAQMKAGIIKKHEMWISVTMMLWKTLEYPLNATTLTRQECEEIMAPAKTEILHGLQICDKFPLVLLFGPQSKLGLGLPHLYTLQGIMHIEDLIHHTSQRTLTGELYRATLEQLLINIGYGSDLFGAPYDELGDLMPYTWMTHLWEFLDNNGIELRHDIVLPLLRQHDSFIMRRAVEAKFTFSKLDAINRCRLYLQVLTLSEIVTADGETITEKAWSGIRDSTIKSPYRWPRQPRPPSKDWRIWQTAITVCYLGSGRRLRGPLGNWRGTDNSWEWFFAPDERRLYQRIDGGWVFWIQKITVRRSPQPLFLRQQVVTERPAICYRARVDIASPYMRLLSVSFAQPCRPPVPTVPRACTLAQTIRELPTSQNWSVQRCCYSQQQGEDILAAIVEGTAMAVSDGSFKDSFGTSAWTLRGASNEEFITGVNVVPGSDDDQSAFRSELAGLYGIIIATTTLCSFHAITNGCITVACDGESALDYIFDWDKKGLKASTPHLDIIEASRKLIRGSSLQWKFRHVYGHQDDFVGPLDRWATLNVEMDLAAKEHWARSIGGGRPASVIFGEPWSVWCKGEKMVTPLRSKLYEVIHGPALDAYWISRKRFKSELYPKYDWEALEDAIRPLSISRRLWLTKHLSGWCSVGRMAKRWNLRASDECPRCHAKENARHVWNYKDPRSIEQMEKSVVTLKLQLGRSYTSPVVINVIGRRLMEWKRGVPFSQVNTTHPFVTEALREQDLMGWDAFLEGSISKAWRQAQEYYLAFSKSPRTSKRWTSALIQKVFEVAWDQWEHRNGILHDVDNKFDKATELRVNREIRNQFRIGKASLPRADHGLFHAGVQRILARSLKSKQNWLHFVSTARVNC